MAGPPKPEIDLEEAFRAASASSGKPVGQLLREIVPLWCGPSRLTPREYFYYRLHDRRYTDAERYIDLLNTFSGHIVMRARQRERLYTEIRQRLARRPDGLLRRHWGCIQNIARRRH